MKSDRGIVVFIVTGWVVICGVIATIITARPFAPSCLLIQAVLFFSPLLLRPLSSLMRRFRKPVFILLKKRKHTWLHLNPWLCTGHLGLRRHRFFRQALTDTLRMTLDKSPLPVFMSSHLLRPNRIARLRRHFPAGHYRFHVIERPVGRAERIGLRIETFLKEWRGFAPSRYGAVVVIRKRKMLRIDCLPTRKVPFYHTNISGVKTMISWKLMQATELACRNVCLQEEAAIHYAVPYNK